MLIEDIHKFERPMQELVQYLKKQKIDVNGFFTKLDLPYQYIIISQYLFIEYGMVMLITPKAMGIKHFKDPLNPDSPIIYREKVEDKQPNFNHCYMKLIVNAFNYIDKQPF